MYQKITNMLTLRYDPSMTSLVPKLAVKDFVPDPTIHAEREILNVVKVLLDDIPSSVSVTLSNGIDGHFTLAMLHHFRPDVKVHGISIGFGDSSDETFDAYAIAKEYGIECDCFTIENPLEDLEHIITNIVQEPRWNVYTYYLFKHCKTKTLYTGDGGDELFAGYIFRYSKLINQRNLDWFAKTASYLNGHNRDWVPDQDELFGNKIRFSWHDTLAQFRDYFDNNLSFLDQILLADYNGKYIHDYIPQSHLLSNHFHLNTRSLFTTNEMLALAMRVPNTMKFDGMRGKLPLQNILGTNTTKKQGFGMNLVHHWNAHGKSLYNEWMNEDSLTVKDGIINLEWVKKEHPADPRYINKKLQLVALEIWYRSLY